MGDIFCLYQGPVEKDGVVYGGPVCVKTRQGFAMAAFTTAELAEYFGSVFKVPGKVVTVSSLDTGGFPVRPKPPLPNPRLQFLFPSKGVLSAWADDREGFDTAPYVTPRKRIAQDPPSEK
ncbi:MAG: hypothetical protein HY078_04990 [Elusimicrobia bacterium]|nr:hypothetical protein [Elusimicrobiota bacterium]